MKIVYVSHTRFPTEKAHGHQIARVCEALTILRHSVTLIAPDLHNEVRQDFMKYYSLRHSFPLTLLPTTDALLSSVIPGRFAFYFTMRSYRTALRTYFTEHRFDLVYARSHHLLPTLLATKIPVVLELHTIPRFGGRKFVGFCNRCKRIVCLTAPMRDALVRLGVDAKKVLVEGDAVDLDRFSKLPSTESAKHHFGLPDDIPTVGYVGSLVTMDNLQKGVDLLVEAAVHMKKTGHEVFVFVVGGPKEWAAKYRKTALIAGLSEHSFRFYGPVMSKLVPDAMAACDVLIYPAPEKKHPYFIRDTSPLKLFEYLASGRPVVCADIPPVRDVVDKTVVRFVHPGSASSLAGGIRDVLDHPKEASQRSVKGLEVVKHHTWTKRMERIMRAL